MKSEQNIRQNEFKWQGDFETRCLGALSRAIQLVKGRLLHMKLSVNCEKHIAKTINTKFLKVREGVASIKSILRRSQFAYNEKPSNNVSYKDTIDYPDVVNN
jgi:hypothetical protein